MRSVRDIAHEIVAREGVYVHDTGDPGGATGSGAKPEGLRRRKHDADAGATGAGDVATPDPAEAARVLEARCFEAPRIGELPVPLQSSVFDMYVDVGVDAVRLLQRVLGDMGLRLVVDGNIGPHTAETAEAAMAAAPHHLVDTYGIARRNHYYALGDRDPAARPHARRPDGTKGGRILRAEEFIAPRYHLSEREHAERTAAWA